MKLALIVLLAGCLDTAGNVCPDQTLCPDTTTCATVGGQTYCVTNDQREACAGLADGTACTIAGQAVGVCHDQICVRAGCGDGFRRGTEQCDGTDLGDLHTCGDLGYHDNTGQPLQCNADCTYDTSACTSLGICGDGVINGDEQCDGTELGGATCRSGGFYNADGLACNTACRYDFGQCSGRCGDGVVDPIEQCDGSVDAQHDTCAKLGFYNGGAVTCGTNCRYDTSLCGGFCGDGIVDGTEQCDGTALGTTDVNSDGVIDCRDLAYYTGTLSCLPNCQLDVAACSGRCGDGQKQASETCDGNDFGGASCTGAGFYTGTLGCSADCTSLVTAGCSQRCGDGVVDGPESCDGTAVRDDEDCNFFGYYTGTLGCTSCSLTIGTCSGFCGDGQLDSAEACDGFIGAATTCAAAGALGTGPLGCDARCRPTFDRCQRGDWETQPPVFFGGNPVKDVWGTNNQDMWFIGQTDGVTLVRRFAEGQLRLFPNISTLMSAIIDVDNTVIVGGIGGVMKQLGYNADGSIAGWVNFPAIVSKGDVTDLWGTHTSELWATTTQGYVMHYDGTAWTALYGPGPALAAIHGASPELVIAVGTNRIVTFVSGVATTTSPAGITFSAVYARTAQDSWAVGTDGTNASVYHTDGTAWTAVSSLGGTWGAQRGVLGGAADDVWIVGEASGGVANGGIRLFFDGNAITPALGSVPALEGLGGTDTGNLWSEYFNNPTSGGVIEYDGRGWGAPAAPALTTSFTAISASPTGVWLVGTGATPIVRHDARVSAQDPTRWTMPTPPGLTGTARAVWSTSADDAWVFADTIAWHYVGGVWSSSTLAATITGAWGVGDQVFAVGDSTVEHFDGASWTATAIGWPVRTVGGSGPTDVWIAGGTLNDAHGDHVFHSTDGATWTYVPFAAPGPINIASIYAASPYAVWVVGDSGGLASLVMWDGGSWNFDNVDLQNPPPLTGVSGSGPNDVWTVGSVGGLPATYHWDGAVWTQIALGELRPSRTLQAIAAGGGADMWTVGGSGEILHLDHRLPALTGGACPDAIPMYCVGSPPGQTQLDNDLVGSVIGGASAYYVLDAPLEGTLDLALTATGVPQQLSVLVQGADGTCNALAPIATSAAGASATLQSPLEFGKRYYLAIATPTSGLYGGYDVQYHCDKPFTP